MRTRGSKAKDKDGKEKKKKLGKKDKAEAEDNNETICLEDENENNNNANPFLLTVEQELAKLYDISFGYQEAVDRFKICVDEYKNEIANVQKTPEAKNNSNYQEDLSSPSSKNLINDKHNYEK